MKFHAIALRGPAGVERRAQRKCVSVLFFLPFIDTNLSIKGKGFLPLRARGRRVPMASGSGGISRLALQRLPTYLSYLKNLPEGGPPHISAAAIAAGLGLGEVQVRKDLAMVSDAGKPKVGYPVDGLVKDLEHFLGYGTCNRTVLVGVGNLGLALLSYSGFAEYGLHFVAAFDVNPALIGSSVDQKPILSVDKLPVFCRENGIQIGVLTVPAVAAQACCNALVAGGVRAVWNFAPVHLQAPPHVLVQRENMASSLALLSYHLKTQEAQAPQEEQQSGTAGQ